MTTLSCDLLQLQCLAILVERTKETTTIIIINETMHLDTKNNVAAGYQGPVKIELRKSAGLLHIIRGPALGGCTCIDQRGPTDIRCSFTALSLQIQ